MENPGLCYYNADETMVVLKAIHETLSLDPRTKEHKKREGSN